MGEFFDWVAVFLAMNVVTLVRFTLNDPQIS